MNHGEQAKMERWIFEQTGLVWWTQDSETKAKLRAAYRDLQIVQAKSGLEPVPPVNPEAAAYRWAYEYLQSRMESIGRHGWAHDCDGEIEDRIATAGKTVLGQR